jgi:hypothetical protein
MYHAIGISECFSKCRQSVSLSTASGVYHNIEQFLNTIIRNELFCKFVTLAQKSKTKNEMNLTYLIQNILFKKLKFTVARYSLRWKTVDLRVDALLAFESKFAKAFRA